ncbi:hypothetical protein C9377_04785 [Streptococcus suis]|nr:hypothetical protein C9377_04785 [Streptococcus suis]QOZ88940.1 hypothetical protein D2E16_06110 [Streptococcus suis]
MLRYVPPYISFLKNNQNTVDTFPRTKGLKISLRHQCHQLEPHCGFKIGSVDTMLYANFENNFEKAVFWYLRF